MNFDPKDIRKELKDLDLEIGAIIDKVIEIERPLLSLKSRHEDLSQLLGAIQNLCPHDDINEYDDNHGRERWWSCQECGVSRNY